MKKEALYFSETSVDLQRTTWLYIPDDKTLHNHRCENLTSCMGVLLFGFLSRYYYVKTGMDWAGRTARMK
jgi:hypothetical protein